MNSGRNYKARDPKQSEELGRTKSQVNRDVVVENQPDEGAG